MWIDTPTLVVVLEAMGFRHVSEQKLIRERDGLLMILPEGGGVFLEDLIEYAKALSVGRDEGFLDDLVSSLLST